MDSFRGLLDFRPPLYNRGGFEVILYEIRGGGRTWPGRARAESLPGKTTMNIDANDLMWEFFSRHTLR
jgi:polyhydroxybutyrate depolymerase